MAARLHEIEGREKAVDILPGRLADFTLGRGRDASARLVLDAPGWSLYCFDFEAGAAVFVELPADADLADAPFSVIKQFQLARRVLVAPLDAVEALAQGVPPPGRLILVFSMGRCGSTLAHWMLNKVAGVWALSEPGPLEDVMSRRAELGDGPASRLLKATARLLFRPPAARRASVFAVKFRAHELFDADAARGVPDAKYVFLYREGLGWANSRFRVAQRLRGHSLADAEGRKAFWRAMTRGRPLDYLTPLFDIESDGIDFATMIAAVWALHVETYETLLADGVPFLAVRYDELDRDREAAALRLLDHCGLPRSALPRALEAFEADSQAGTSLSRTMTSAHLDEGQRSRFRAVLARHPRIRRPDHIVADVHASGDVNAPAASMR